MRYLRRRKCVIYVILHFAVSAFQRVKDRKDQPNFCTPQSHSLIFKLSHQLRCNMLIIGNLHLTLMNRFRFVLCFQIGVSSSSYCHRAF